LTQAISAPPNLVIPASTAYRSTLIDTRLCDRDCVVATKPELGPTNTRPPIMPNPPPDSAPPALHFAEFALRAWRDDPRHIQVIAHATPVGGMGRPVTVKLGRIRRSDFDMGVGDTLAHAANIGRELSRILLPEAVLALLMESIRYAAQRGDMGLRLRLCLDDELIDLPWECLYRPDLTGPAQLDGFFLADGDLSLVREAASLPFTPAPTERTQRALFLGTLFDDQPDYWFTRDEFKALRRPLMAARFAGGDWRARHRA